MILLRLFYEFFMTGLFAVGGGLATLPFLERISANTGWFTHQSLIDMIAISEATPGPIGINMATYVGYITAGIPGALVATLAEVLPSLIIVLILARFLKAFAAHPTVKAVFYGIRPASVGMIAAAGFSVLKISLLDLPAFGLTRSIADLFQWKSLILGAVLAVALNIKEWKIHPALAIAASAAIGVVFRFGR
ncbi:MAG: chromate transporter [Oscillospiraceae bacterium]|jgi:chromate transporter|nr:chromate transporter [Oscillospiraceae bacterium]